MRKVLKSDTFRKIFLIMAGKDSYKSLEDWIEKYQSNGRLTFSLTEAQRSFENNSESALKQALDRLSKKGKIISVFKGFYVIVPAQYSAKGILPATMFIDALMKSLDRKYYVALLNAAAFHGSSHQQPQEYFVITEYPVLRTTNKRGVKINYISTKQLPPETLTEKKKTETGYIIVSNPVLTALDLINYQKRIGGINRAATVINELLERTKPGDFKDELIKYASASSLQRLGFILDEVLNRKQLADRLFTLSKKAGTKFYLIPLRPSEKKGDGIINEKWKLRINTEIEID